MIIDRSGHPTPRANAHDHGEEVKTMALRKSKSPARGRTRVWDALSESAKSVWLESERRGSQARIEQPRVVQPDWKDASVMRRFQ